MLSDCMSSLRLTYQAIKIQPDLNNLQRNIINHLRAQQSIEVTEGY